MKTVVVVLNAAASALYFVSGNFAAGVGFALVALAGTGISDS